MKKIKKVWEENRILLVLAVILIMCIIIVGVVSLKYFYGSSDNVYGDRLDSIKDVTLNKDLLNNIESELKKNESVNKVVINVKGKIVYISVEFANGTKMDDAKKIAETTPELFSEEELLLYELEFTISTSEYTLMGARNTSGSGMIVWNNYNIESDTIKED